jgi:type VI secretion system protein ImpF
VAELTTKERLQPSLLDRLTDDDPEKKQESRDRRVMSTSRFREAVLRDLVWLLNTGSLDVTEDLEDYPLVARSVLNYGMPELAGVTGSSLIAGELERSVRQAILDFEPRILRNTVKVRAMTPGGDVDQNAIILEIEGTLWGHPNPQQLFLKTEVDLETGDVAVTELGGRSAR